MSRDGVYVRMKSAFGEWDDVIYMELGEGDELLANPALSSVHFIDPGWLDILNELIELAGTSRLSVPPTF